ncbi:MAG: hypothetical protein NC922_08730 [Candidatus Omnitrophica bacterium]|nr:hypothetical protein [Candidatus Omnitrophota bacterium]
MKKFIFLIFCLISFLFSQDNVFLFDMGPENSPVLENFIKITEKDIYQTGKYGWETKNCLSFDQNFSKYAEGSLDLDPLLRDFVKSNSHLSIIFSVDVPKGKYNVGIIAGQIYTGNSLVAPSIWYSECYIRINDKKIFEKEYDFIKYAKFIFSRYEDDFIPGDSLFKKYILPYYQIIKTSTDEIEKIKIEFSSAVPVNGIIIYPDEKTLEFNKKIEEIIENSKKYVDDKFKLIEVKKEEGLIKKYKDESFLTFSIPYYEKLTPYLIPNEERINQPIKKTCSKGEKIILSFGILPIKDLKNVELEISDLISDSKDKIPKEKFSFWLTKYIPELQKQSPGKFSIEEKYALKYKKSDFVSLIPKKILLITEIPEDIKDGEYKGKITIKSGNYLKELPISIKVLPFKLDESDIYFGFYTKYPRSSLFRYITKEDEIFTNFCNSLMENILKEMKELGFNWACIEKPWHPIIIKDEKIEITPNLKKWDTVYLLYKKYFPKAPFIIYSQISPNVPYNLEGWRKTGFTEEIKKQTQLVIDWVSSYFEKEKCEREIAIYISDELSNWGLEGGKFGVEKASLMKKIVEGKNIKLFASMNGIPEHSMIPYLDFSVINFDFPITEETINKIKSAGSKLVFYNIGNNRFSYGYYIAKLNPFGRLQWTFGPEHNIFYNFPSFLTLGHINYATIIDSDFNIGKRMDVIDMSEGVTDYRYYLTLKNLIEKNKGTKDKKLKEILDNSESFLKYLTSSIKTDIRYYVREATPFNSETCEKIRTMIANYIMEVLNANK